MIAVAMRQTLTALLIPQAIGALLDIEALNAMRAVTTRPRCILFERVCQMARTCSIKGQDRHHLHRRVSPFPSLETLAMPPRFLTTLWPRSNRSNSGRPVLQVLRSLTWVQWGHFIAGYKVRAL